MVQMFRSHIRHQRVSGLICCDFMMVAMAPRCTRETWWIFGSTLPYRQFVVYRSVCDAKNHFAASRIVPLIQSNCFISHKSASTATTQASHHHLHRVASISSTSEMPKLNFQIVRNFRRRSFIMQQLQVKLCSTRRNAKKLIWRCFAVEIVSCYDSLIKIDTVIASPPRVISTWMFSVCHANLSRASY